MKSYVLNLNDGSTSEFYCSTDTEAILMAESILGDVYASDQWDADGKNDDGEEMKRLLFWDSEADSENDPGANAIASLSAIGIA